MPGEEWWVEEILKIIFEEFPPNEKGYIRFWANW
jgi:hypothetical protein